MTIRMVITCDGRGCVNELETYSNTTLLKQAMNRGWVIDQDNPEYQYCPDCSKKIIAEKRGNLDG